MKLITDTDYCPFRNFDDVCSLCNCECISGEALSPDCPLIRNGGIPLPKGHGRLIDVDCLNTGCGIRACDCVGDCDKCSDCVVSYSEIRNAETIVAADEVNDNETDN